MRRERGIRIGWLAAGLGGMLVALATAQPALADPPCGKGWRKGEWCGGHHREHYYAPAPVVVVPGPVYVAPPPVMYAPPPVVYAPPVVAPVPAPGLSIGVNIPLR